MESVFEGMWRGQKKPTTIPKENSKRLNSLQDLNGQTKNPYNLVPVLLVLPALTVFLYFLIKNLYIPRTKDDQPKN